MGKTGIDVLYWIVVATVLASTVVEDMPLLHYCSKPLLMVILLVRMLPLRTKAVRLGAIAVAFSWVGDILLMMNSDLVPSVNEQSWFMLGLVAFLVAHVFYISSFMQVDDSSHQVHVIKKYPLIMFGYGGLTVLIFIKLSGNLGDMAIPVFLYTVAILVVLLTGTNRYGRVPIKSFLLVLVGTWLFTLSDSLIAFNKFSKEIPMAAFWIMLTYAGAQWLIVKGLLRGETT
jgi:uncharacterized membrane protein YhhN